MRTPHDEVFAVGCGDARRFVVHLPDGTPGAVGGTEHTGGVHPLLCAPLSVVRGAELSYLYPSLLDVEVSGVQTGSFVG